MANIKNTRDTILQAATRVTTTAVGIIRSNSVFLKAKNTATTALTPDTINLTTNITGFTAPVYSWYYANSTAPETFTLIADATLSSYSITSTTFLTHVATSVSVIYKCKVTQAGWADAESVTTITYNKQNNDIPVAVLNKTSIVLPTTSADVADYTNSGTRITVSIGGTNIAYAATGPSTFSVSAAVTTGTITVAASPTTETTTVTNDTRVYGNLSGMAAGNSPATITYTVTARDIDSVATTFTLVQTISKATAGATGAAGAGTYTLNFTNATYGANQSTIIKTDATAAWNAQAYSTQGYVDSVYCSAKSTAVPNTIMFGLNSDPAFDTSYTSIDYAWYFYYDNSAYIFENGVEIGGSYTYTTDTVLSITYDGISIKYYVDGILKRTVARAPGAALYFDSSFYNPGQGIKDVVFGPGGATGATGATGQSNHRIYIVAANSSATPATPSTTTSGATPASWSSTPITLTGTQAQFQSDGVTPANSTTTTWGTPYLSYFKVDTLEAITVNTGALTVSDSLTIGTSGNIKSGKANSTDYTAGFFLGSESSTTKFTLGDSTAFINWNGTRLGVYGYIDGGFNGVRVGSIGTLVVDAINIIPGGIYKIVTTGTTTWTSIGASSNTVGVVFEATTAGSGNGTATKLYTNRVALGGADRQIMVNKHEAQATPAVYIYDTVGGTDSFYISNTAANGSASSINTSGSNSKALATYTSGTTSTALSVTQTGSGDASYGLVINTASDNPTGSNFIKATGTSATSLVVVSTGASSGSTKFFNTGNTNNSKSVTFTASTDRVNATAHGYGNGAAVVFSGISGGVGISQGTIYYVKNANANDFQVSASATSAAAVVDITTDGSGTAGIPRQFWGAPGGYAAYSPSGGGKQYFLDGAGPFTGFHNVLVPKTTTLQLGECLVDLEVAYRLDISNVMFFAELSSMPEQVGVIGIVSAIGEINDLIYLPEELRNQYKATHWLVDINAVGEGQILVSGKAGNIQKGDLLAAGISGIAQKQSSNQVFNYTVAKARESVNFSSNSEVKMIACIYMCG